MSNILERINKRNEEKQEAKEMEENPSPEQLVEKPSIETDSVEHNKIQFDFSLEELEFLIRMIGDTNFKGNDLMFIYELVNKLQNLYLDRKGVQ